MGINKLEEGPFVSKAETFISQFMTHRTVLLDLINTLSDKDIDFRPWDGAMSTGDLIWHMLSSGRSFAEAAATGQFVRYSDKPAFQTIADIRAAAEEYTNKTLEVIRTMSDEQFAQDIDMTKVFGRAIPAGVLLHMLRDHEIHHKGQLFVYARICGVEQLPSFVHIG